MKPQDEQSPFIAEWESFSEDGEAVLRELRPEDVLDGICQGLTPEELAAQVSAPLDAVEHVICHIPHMMAWRRESRAKAPSNNEDGAFKLPVLHEGGEA